MSGGGAVPELRLATTQSVKDGIFNALRPLVGPNRPHTAEDIAIALRAVGHDIKPETVTSWVAGSEENRRTPPTAALLILCQYLGKEFTTKVLSVIGMGAYHQVPAIASPASVVATLAMATHRFAEAGVDHVFSNAELGELEPIADAGIAVLEPFSSRRKG